MQMQWVRRRRESQLNRMKWVRVEQKTGDCQCRGQQWREGDDEEKKIWTAECGSGTGSVSVTAAVDRPHLRSDRFPGRVGHQSHVVTACQNEERKEGLGEG